MACISKLDLNLDKLKRDIEEMEKANAILASVETNQKKLEGLESSSWLSSKNS